MELPPHTRRRVYGYSGACLSGGTTSAYAEKSCGARNWWLHRRNYLRIRGEECSALDRACSASELPPHTRRRVPCFPSCRYQSGTTSAYAEKSLREAQSSSTSGNYLRIRGEESTFHGGVPWWAELPPHTRRRVAAYPGALALAGTTSAYAEKRKIDAQMLEKLGNYLRIRGEEPPDLTPLVFHEELPPHTRRRAPIEVMERPTLRTTSAYAEKSCRTRPWRIPSGNYLRIRGEESPRLTFTPAGAELPPHTRRRVIYGIDGMLKPGTTSAYAEKSAGVCSAGRYCGNYLRIRGEERCRPAQSFPVRELPPHTRRRAGTFKSRADEPGTTSAYAEKSVKFGAGWLPKGNYLRIRGEETFRVSILPFDWELPPHTRRRGR